MNNFQSLLAPVREAFVNGQVHFIMSNYEELFNELYAYGQKKRELMNNLYVIEQEIRDLDWSKYLKVKNNPYQFEETAEAARELMQFSATLNPNSMKYKIASEVTRLMETKGEAAAIGYATAVAEQAWNKREKTIAKAVVRKGVDIDNLVKCEMQENAGYEFRLFMKDAEGKTANARAILAWGEIVAPHMRFICS